MNLKQYLQELKKEIEDNLKFAQSRHDNWEIEYHAQGLIAVKALLKYAKGEKA